MNRKSPSKPASLATDLESEILQEHRADAPSGWSEVQDKLAGGARLIGPAGRWAAAARARRFQQQFHLPGVSDFAQTCWALRSLLRRRASARHERGVTSAVQMSRRASMRNYAGPASRRTKSCGHRRPRVSFRGRLSRAGRSLSCR